MPTMGFPSKDLSRTAMLHVHESSPKALRAVGLAVASLYGFFLTSTYNVPTSDKYSRQAYVCPLFTKLLKNDCWRVVAESKRLLIH